MLKNTSLVQTISSGKLSWRLLGPSGEPIHAFDTFARTLQRHSINTRTNYCRWVAEFLDYLLTASACLPSGNSGGVSQADLVDAIEAYDEYLVLGPNSGNEIARRIDEVVSSPLISRRSSASKHAAIRRFLKLSDRIRSQILEVRRNAGEQPICDTPPLIPRINTRVEINNNQKKALATNSVLAGVISGGAKLIEARILPTHAPDISYDDQRAFPQDKVGELLGNLRTYRDRALYAFCAASGCRVSEALQLLWEDVDAKSANVKLVDPASRPNCESYLSLSLSERDCLVWKGRSTSLTLLIEPFSSMFFGYLSEYLKKEYVPHGVHDFVFQYHLSSRVGAPYFLAAASSRNEIFNKAVRACGVSGVQGPHSLRHMYGTYLLNYFPRRDGSFGLPIGIVQKLMGHRHVKDTAKYAKHDRDMLLADLKHAGELIYENGEVKSLIELKRLALLAKVTEIETQMREQGLL